MRTTVASSRKKPRIFYGWWVVVAAWLALCFECGVNFYGFGVFLKSLTDDFGWNRAETAAAMSLYWLTQAILSPVIGGLVDRYGARRLMSAGAITLTIAFLLLTQINSVWQLYAGYIMVGTGATALTLVPAGTAVSNWFSRRRGMVIGITYTGLGFGGVIVPPALTYMNLTLGWRASYFVVAAVILLVVFPAVLLIMRNRPEEKGLLPDGDEAPVVAAAGSRSLHQRGAVSPAAAGPKAYATLIFWLLSGGFLMASLGTLAIAAHQFAFLTDLGWSAEAAAAALSLTGFLSMVGKLFFGNLSDRMSSCYAAVMSFALQGIGLVLVIVFKLDPIVWLYVTMYGLGMGGVPALRPLVVAEVFGMESFGTVYGLTTGVSTVGSVLGPLFAGFIFDLTGKYDIAFTIFAITFVMGISALLFAKYRSQGIKAPLAQQAAE